MMKIDFEMSYEEFSWVSLMTTRCNNVGYKVERVYRDEKGQISISLQPIVLGEYEEKEPENRYD